MNEFLQWNPVVPGVLLAFMIYRATQREFRWISIICILVVAFWFCLALVRLYLRRVKVMPVSPVKRIRLSDAELEQHLGRKRLSALSLARFGGVMISDDVFSGRRVVDHMFREEPKPGLPFSGWTFFSSESGPNAADGAELHDCLAILRVAPEVAPYLDKPPGTVLIRTGETTFEAKKGDGN